MNDTLESVTARSEATGNLGFGDPPENLDPSLRFGMPAKSK